GVSWPESLASLESAADVGNEVELFELGKAPGCGLYPSALVGDHLAAALDDAGSAGIHACPLSEGLEFEVVAAVLCYDAFPVREQVADTEHLEDARLVEVEVEDHFRPGDVGVPLVPIDVEQSLNLEPSVDELEQDLLPALAH